ncbi:MAG: bifunctional diaminohydroxyphosphoribosylaminopyrimidine deaminase/5-amino-6-(5-phosphoribosylamino)uracil reductase RibD [Nitrospira sp.]|nr:bifunctional diaminohydroxyphosphoribosylaminopyrimidine deaminase/5-amino-6-(5-phosphoribosylamino)uracil reductase RibD [Nitrospira sp.]MCP9461259.1 bifunctional diaminohydroxyphosphoribosylaminopyrimidine deaminase/5-amino-6-(5-phosphoribosylamino)uracil reductase RibD [Nitrospira sp.]
MTRDLDFMALALRLAEKGRGTASPNPMVGAVVVREGRIVGRGFHLRPGLPHAEILALRQAGDLAAGATLYVTLEPCCHRKKRTPPCVPAVIASGIRRVVVAMTDPNPSVRGRGVAALRRAGLAVTVGVARREAEELNKAYSHWMKTKRPYVTLKAGMTLDGKIATATGESKWITGQQSRREAHRLRREADAVLVGAGTVMRDDPSLTARTGLRLARLAERQPLRVVVDSRLRIPLKAKVLAQQEAAKTVVATTVLADPPKKQALLEQGIEVLTLPVVGGSVSLAALMSDLGKRGITSVLLEGGGKLNAAMLKARLVQHVRLYVAPLLLGGDDAKSVIAGRGPARLASAMRLRHLTTRMVGGDLVVEGDV